MKLKASVAVATLAIGLSAAAAARAESCRCAERAGRLPVVVQEYYPHADRRPAPVAAPYAPPAPPSDASGFPDFDYDADDLAYAAPFVGGYGLGGYGFSGIRRDGWDNDRGGGHSRIRPGPIGMGRR